MKTVERILSRAVLGELPQQSDSGAHRDHYENPFKLIERLKFFFPQNAEIPRDDHAGGDMEYFIEMRIERVQAQLRSDHGTAKNNTEARDDRGAGFQHIKKSGDSG